LKKWRGEVEVVKKGIKRLEIEIEEKKENGG
jgi:hypothetical protein